VSWIRHSAKYPVCLVSWPRHSAKSSGLPSVLAWTLGKAWFPGSQNATFPSAVAKNTRQSYKKTSFLFIFCSSSEQTKNTYTRHHIHHKYIHDQYKWVHLAYSHSFIYQMGTYIIMSIDSLLTSSWHTGIYSWISSGCNIVCLLSKSHHPYSIARGLLAPYSIARTRRTTLGPHWVIS
jgi:hypothetical protein